MKQNINIEAEGSELILKNKAGDYVIIPKKYRTEVQDMVKDGCHGCIDRLVETLPVMNDYAEDGSLFPDWNKVKATLNPKNWGVSDYSDKGNRHQAYAAARKAGEKEFMWNNKRFNTDYDLSKEEISNKGNRLVNTALKMAEKKVDTYRPPLGKKEKIQSFVTGKEKFTSQPCVTAVCNMYKKAGINSGIPEGVYDNRIFANSYKDYGFELIPNNDLKPGDIVQYLFQSDDLTDEWHNKPYHLGVYTGDDYYVSDGDKEDPIMRKNLYTDDEGNKKNPFIVYRKTSRFFTDEELSELDINKKNFDIQSLQRELSNRNYKLPKSTKENGDFDGIWGDETKNALLDYQTKNKKNEYKPLEQKNITSEYKPYTAVQDNTYVAPKVIRPLEQKEKQQFISREQPVLKADTRTEQQRKIAQEYTESVLNPSILTQIGEGFQKPLRWLADPVKGVGDIVSAIAPNSTLAKDLPNTNEDVFEYRKKQLDPYKSTKEKINNTINEAIPLTNWAILNTLPVEAIAGNTVKSTIKSGKKLIKTVGVVDDGVKQANNVKTLVNQLEEPPLEIVFDDMLPNRSSTINLNRGDNYAKMKKQVPYEKIDLGNDLTLYNNASRQIDDESILGTNRAIKSIKNEKTNEYIDLKSWKEKDKIYYYFSANMPSSKIKAGKAYIELEKHIPVGSEILENSSLSMDSFNNILKQLKNPKFESSVKGKITLNNMSVNNKVPFGEKQSVFANTDKVMFDNLGDANVSVNEINKILKTHSLPEASVVSSSIKFQPQAHLPYQTKIVYNIELPNISLKKLYTILGITGGVEAIQSQNNKTE